MKQLIIVLGLGALSLPLVEKEARACSVAPCAQGIVAPATGASISAATTSLAYARSRAQLGASWTPAVTFEPKLLDANGTVIATTTVADPWWPGGNLLVLATPLAAGAYQLTYVETCSGQADRAQGFNVISDAPPLSAIGSLQLSGFPAPRTIAATDICRPSKGADAVSATLTVTPTPELLSYLPMTSFAIAVDGVEKSKFYYGAWKLSGGRLPLSINDFSSPLYAVCGNRDAAYDNGLPIGVHTVTVSAHVAGSSSDPPTLSAQFDFSCTSDAIRPVGEDAADGGCAVAHASQTPSNGIAWTIGLVIACFALRRRVACAHASKSAACVASSGDRESRRLSVFLLVQLPDE